MKLIIAGLAALLAIGAVILIVGWQGQIVRIVIGVILLVAAGALVYLAQMRPTIQQVQTTVTQKIDLSGDVNLEEMKCRNCNAPLTKDAIEVKAGGIFVTCPACGTSYQIEEQAKY
jgi:Zn finger protein HypA/HybF involved in hydrogenase expression